MKILTTLLIATVSLTACESLEQSKHDHEIADAKSFEYFFRGASDARVFSTLEEARDFIGAARVKLASSIKKQPTKGLAARLVGPVVSDRKPVVVVHILNASTLGGAIDLRNAKEDLGEKLLNANTVASVYLVFYADRGSSLSDFYVADDYHFTSNTQYKSFRFRNNTYEADYPIGWDIKQVFQYLNKEID